MPEICRFFGIINTMYADDHNPPYFHLLYSEFEELIIIAKGNLLEGEVPNKQLRLV